MDRDRGHLVQAGTLTAFFWLTELEDRPPICIQESVPQLEIFPAAVYFDRAEAQRTLRQSNERKSSSSFINDNESLFYGIGQSCQQKKDMMSDGADESWGNNSAFPGQYWRRNLSDLRLHDAACLALRINRVS
ncbi:hypothetical protein FA95DRAFT_1096868 [Auriscalpium vulgare]|uniref:Uncharacterized protein n=1 Tax=Auriscalpium vulgare TaxID=40419 RepID=A0ACB8RVK6_9AGAM|nr:hypothetical protein FA95DRAFT_1096868 [Auriscalpium vulgare]